MDATQQISDSILESDEEENEEEGENKRGRPLAKLCIFKNEHIPETELPLFLGDNVLGRDPNTCTLPLPAPSISKQHATICISVYRRRGSHNKFDVEGLVWDLGSMNGTRKGRLKLTPDVRYALSNGDSLVLADIPCQYVSSAVDQAFSQGEVGTPVSKIWGGKAKLPDASGEKGGDKCTDSLKCVNGGAKAMVSLTETPVRTTCLSFEQTPNLPQGTLVPESDSDSDGERGDRRRKALVSESDSHKSSPACSTFLSPTNKIVPESEDESPITPSSSTKNRPYRHVSFSKEETEVDAGGQVLEGKKVLEIVDDSEEENGMEEERAAPEGTKSEESGQHMPGKQENNVSPAREDELPMYTSAVSTNAIPAFNMDSDTDVEGEEEGVASAGPVALNTDQVSQAPNTAQFHMDSDTDVDDNEDASNEAPKTVSSSNDDIKPPHVNSVIQPEEVNVDSDTDVDDDAAASDAATKAQPMSCQGTQRANTALLTQPKDLHFDSDTDVDEEEEKECGTNKSSSKIAETQIRLGIQPTRPESAPAAPRSPHSDRDDILCDSDTDLEADSPLVIPVTVTTLSAAPGAMSESLGSDSDADTDVDESSVPPAGDGAHPPDLRVGSNTDVEDKEADEGQIPNLCRENTPGFLVPPLQKCSTPVQLSEREVEGMDTQAFLSPSSVPLRLVPAVGPVALSSCSDSQEDDDFVVAETQSFILQTRDRQSGPPEEHTLDPTQDFSLGPSGDEKDEQSSRGGSFHLGLSNSSHLQCQAMDSTQAFVSVDRSMNVEDTQTYAAISPTDRASAENDPNLAATQAYGADEEPARCLVMSEKEGQMDLALEETQAYISEAYSDSENKTGEKERKNISATAETQLFGFPTSCTLVMAETQPVSAFSEEESLATDEPGSSAHEVKSLTLSEAEDRGPPHRLIAETQPMQMCDDEESDDEDSFPVPQKRKAKPLQLEIEQTQPLSNSELSVAETQPMHIAFAETLPMTTSGNEESEDGDSMPGPRKRKAKQLHLEEEHTQTRTNSELSTAETQPVHTGEYGDSDEEDLILGSRGRKAKPLQLAEKQTQPLIAETQPIATGEDEESDDEDSIPVSRKRRAKALQLEEEQTQPLSAETQPIATGEDEESDDEDSMPVLRKRRAKALQLEEEQTQPLTISDISTVDTQPSERETYVRPERRKGRQSEAENSGVSGNQRRTRATFREEEESSEPPKRQTRGKNKAVPTTSGRRGKSRLEEDESEEEEEGRVRRARGKKSTRQQKDEEEEKQEGGLGEEKDVAHPSYQEREQLVKEKREINDRGREQEEVVRQHRREEQTKLERERKEKEERLQAENAERVRLEQERADKERKEQDEKERSDQIQREKEEHMERERKEREEKQRLEREKAEQEEKEKLEKERLEKERKEREEKELEERAEKERKEQEEKERSDRIQREKEEQMERERKERLQREKAEKEKEEKLEKERLEKERKEQEEKELEERAEKERKEQEEKERSDRILREKEEQMERERKERLEREKAEQEEEEKLEKERLEKERKEQEEKDLEERLEKERMEQQARLQSEAKEREEEQTREQQENKEEAHKPNVANRGRRAARRTIATPRTTEPEQDSTVSTNDDVPARRTRSRSNSSNSVSSERSASSVTTQEVRGRGRGRGAKRTSEPPQAPIARGSNRRRTVAAGTREQDSNDISPQGILSRTNSSSSLNSEISNCSVSSQNRGRGGRQRGRQRKAEPEPDSIPPVNPQSGQNVTPKPTARGRKSRKTDRPSNVVAQEDTAGEAGNQQAGTTRGQCQASTATTEPTAADEEGRVSEESPLPRSNVRGRGQRAVKTETIEAPVAPTVSGGDEIKVKRKGRKRELEENTEGESSGTSKISKGKEKAQTVEATVEEVRTENPVQGNRRGRASTSQDKNAKESPLDMEMKEETKEEEIIDKKARGRQSVAQKKKRGEQEESGTSVSSIKQNTKVEAPEPQTPTSRKRQAPADSTPVAKTPRSSSASPAASGRLRAASQAYKVLFTGMVDEAGERVIARLGGSMAKGVADMNCLVTDKVRRTVKFLCAVAKGIPIVTTQWLEKSGKAGSFLSPNAFAVKDSEQEKKFSFCLQESLRIASTQPLLQGYEIHVTKSVKPEPIQMKDIISCSGATFLPKMPSTHKPQTVVISCEEDWSLCHAAVSASIPVVTAEFILTGILQQKVDFQLHTVAAPATSLPPAGGRGRGRKRT